MGDRLTGSLAQAGVLSRGTLRRNLEVHLPSEPYRYPRLPPSPRHVTCKRGSAVRLGSEKDRALQTTIPKFESDK